MLIEILLSLNVTSKWFLDTVFTFFGIFKFFNLSITEETWVVLMRFYCIKIGKVLVLNSNTMVEASTGGLLVHEGLYSLIAKYFRTCFKIRIWIELSRKSKFCKLISKQRIISHWYNSIHRWIWLNFMALCLVSIRWLFQFSLFSPEFSSFSTLASVKRRH
jgi:hypothetical protein